MVGGFPYTSQGLAWIGKPSGKLEARSGVVDSSIGRLYAGHRRRTDWVHKMVVVGRFWDLFQACVRSPRTPGNSLSDGRRRGNWMPTLGLGSDIPVRAQGPRISSTVPSGFIYDFTFVGTTR